MQTFKITLFLIICLASKFSNSQNLVPNASFENYSECPKIQGDFFVDNWYNILNHNGTADFFHTCSNGLFGIPENFHGTQIPKDGDAFVGIGCFNNLSFELREYFQVKLISPLISEQFYKISFFVVLGNNQQFAINNIGAAITNTAIEGNNTLDHLSIIPQVFSNDIISDKDNWTEISGIFQANGGESYLTIGTYFSDKEILIIDFPESKYATSYYFVDSVSITAIDEPIQEQDCLNFINPVHEIIYLNSTTDINSLDAVLYDISGKRIKKKIIENEIYVGDLSVGVYIMHYKCGTKTDYKKIIKI